MEIKQKSTEKISETKVNWEVIHKKINSLKDVLTQKAVLSNKEQSSLLKIRATKLSKEKKDETIQKEFVEIIEFVLSFETYAIETTFVKEVYPLKDMTVLPGVPNFILGIINVRGQIISVINVKKFFNLPEKGLGELNKVIIIHNKNMEFGILADKIIGNHLIEVDNIQSSPVSISGIAAEYLKGVADNQIIILDAEKILNDENIIVNQK